MRRRSSGNAKGDEEAESGHMVVGTGVTMDCSAVDDRTLTVSWGKVGFENGKRDG